MALVDELVHLGFGQVRTEQPWRRGVGRCGAPDTARGHRLARVHCPSLPGWLAGAVRHPCLMICANAVYA